MPAKKQQVLSRKRKEIPDVPAYSVLYWPRRTYSYRENIPKGPTAPSKVPTLNKPETGTGSRVQVPSEDSGHVKQNDPPERKDRKELGKKIEAVSDVFALGVPERGPSIAVRGFIFYNSSGHRKQHPNPNSRHRRTVPEDSEAVSNVPPLSVPETDADTTRQVNVPKTDVDINFQGLSGVERFKTSVTIQNEEHATQSQNTRQDFTFGPSDQRKTWHPQVKREGTTNGVRESSPRIRLPEDWLPHPVRRRNTDSSGSIEDESRPMSLVETSDKASNKIQGGLVISENPLNSGVFHQYQPQQRNPLEIAIENLLQKKSERDPTSDISPRRHVHAQRTASSEPKLLPLGQISGLAINERAGEPLAPAPPPKSCKTTYTQPQRDQFHSHGLQEKLERDPDSEPMTSPGNKNCWYQWCSLCSERTRSRAAHLNELLTNLDLAHFHNVEYWKRETMLFENLLGKFQEQQIEWATFWRNQALHRRHQAWDHPQATKFGPRASQQCGYDVVYDRV